MCWAAISAAGGLTEDAGSEVEVMRQPAPTRFAQQEPVEGEDGVVRQVSHTALPTGLTPQVATRGAGAEPIMLRINLAQAATGESSLGRQLGDRDVVMVLPRKKRVIHVAGLVKKPDQFELPHDQDVRVLDAIAMAGGRSSTIADKVFVVRQQGVETEPAVIELSVSKAKQSGKENLILMAGDLVSVESTVATTARERRRKVLPRVARTNEHRVPILNPLPAPPVMQSPPDDASAYADEPDAMQNALQSVVRFLRLVLRRRQFVGGVLLTTVAAGMIYFAVATRYYASVAKLMINKQTPDRVASLNEQSHTDNIMESQREVVRSQRVIQAAIQRLRPEHRIDLLDKDPSDWVKVVSARLSASTVRKTNHMAVSYQSKNPEAAAAVVSAVIGAYIDFCSPEPPVRRRGRARVARRRTSEDQAGARRETSPAARATARVLAT